MNPTIGEALLKALEMEKQGCITSTAQALILLSHAYREVVGEEVYQQFVLETSLGKNHHE